MDFFINKCSDCGTVNSAVTSDSKGPMFESCHRQLLLNNYLMSTVCRKDENKVKEAREWMANFKKNTVGMTVR